MDGVSVRAGLATITSQLISGNYPKWRQVVPGHPDQMDSQKNRHTIFGEITEEISSVAKRVSRLPVNTDCHKELEHVVTIRLLENHIQFSRGAGKFAVSAKWTGTPPPIGHCISLNEKYLTGALNWGWKRFEMSSETSPMEFISPNGIGRLVVMPMRKASHP